MKGWRNVARIEEMRYAYKIFVGKPYEESTYKVR
jgi:hypothetical protein